MNGNSIPAISVAGESITGLVRSKNEDSFCLCAEKNSANILAVVADGVGGHAHGDIASYLCCRSLLEQWRSNGYGNCKAGKSFAGKFRDCIKKANDSICFHNYKARNWPGMCTTLVAAVITPEQLFVFNVGDSPFMLQRNGVLHQITENHNWGDSQTIISRAVGVKKNIEIDTHLLPRCREDRYLLCSDGLSGYVSEDKIGELFWKAHSPRAAVDSLLKAALLAGGADNVTVIAAFEEE